MKNACIRSVILTFLAAAAAGCANVRYTERLADGTTREYRSLTIAKDIEAKGEIHTATGPSRIEVASSSREATHVVGNLGASAIGAVAGAAVSGGPGAGVGAAAGGGIAEVWQQVQDWLRSRQDAPTATTNAPATDTPDTPAAEPAQPAAAAWPAYPAIDFWARGDGRWEIERRLAYVNAARAAGHNCLRIGTDKTLTEEEAYHCLHYSSDARPNYFLTGDNFTHSDGSARGDGGDSWWTALNNRGITRLQLQWNGANGAQWAEWTQRHTALDLQVVCAPEHLADARRLFAHVSVVAE